VRDIPRLVWTLAAGRFVNAAGSFLWIYLFVYLSGPRGLTLSHAGLVSGALGAGMLAGNLTGGRLGDRYGHRRVMLLASTVTGLTTLAVPWTPALALAVTMPLLGYATATAGVSQGALVALAMPAGDRRRAIAVTRAAFNAGCAIGPVLGALLAAEHLGALFVIDGIVTLIVRAVTARLLPADPVRPAATVTPASAAAPAGPASPVAAQTPDAPMGERPVGLLRSLRADRSLLTLLPAIVAVDLVYRQLYSTLPAYLRDHGQPLTLYATLIAVGSGIILLLEIPATIAMRRLPALRIIATGYALIGAGMGLFILGASAAITIAAMVVLTAGEILYKTTATAHVLDRAPAGLTGQYQGLYTAAATSGTMLAPPLGALLYSHAPAALWPACALLAGGAALLAWRSGQARATQPALATSAST
jgi:MFS family permease